MPKKWSSLALVAVLLQGIVAPYLSAPSLATSTPTLLCSASGKKEDDQKKTKLWETQLQKTSTEHSALGLQTTRKDFLRKISGEMVPACEKAAEALKAYQAFSQATRSAELSGGACEAYQKIETNYTYLSHTLSEQEDRFEKLEKDWKSHFERSEKKNRVDVSAHKTDAQVFNVSQAQKLDQEVIYAWGAQGSAQKGLFQVIRAQLAEEIKQIGEKRGATKDALQKVRSSFPYCPSKLSAEEFAAKGKTSAQAKIDASAKDSNISDGKSDSLQNEKNPKDSSGNGTGENNSDTSTGDGKDTSGSSTSGGEDSGLSTGAKVAIAGGVVAVAAGVGGALYLKKKYGVDYGEIWKSVTGQVEPENKIDADLPKSPEFFNNEPDSKPGKMYMISGQHTKYGPYRGFVETREKADGTPEVLRAVTYDSFKFDGFDVREVWLGNGKVEAGKLSAKFKLKQGECFTKVEGATRTKAQFNTPLEIGYSVKLGASAPVTITNAAWISNEKTTGQSQDGDAKPTWKNLRQVFSAPGGSSQYLGRLSAATLFKPAIDRYRSDPLVTPYKDRLEFKSQKQYYIIDPTDLDFLLANPNTVRVANKVTDDISLTEAALRRDAYAYTLVDKAKIFDQDSVDNYLNELGFINYTYFDASGKKQSHFLDGDALLWTGMYGASQAMRYMTTKEPAALNNFKKVLKALMLAMDVTQNPKTFARNAMPYSSDVKLTDEIVRGTGAYSDVVYQVGGNNDMVKGIFIGFAFAYYVLPEGDPLLTEVGYHAGRLPSLDVVGEISHPGNGFVAKGLAAIAEHSTSHRNDYLTRYLTGIVGPDAVGANDGFYYGGIADWSGINLGMVSRVAQALVANKVLLEFTGTLTDGTEKAALKHSRQSMMTNWSTYAGAHKEFLAVAGQTFGLRGDLFGFPSNTTPDSWNKRELWEKDLSQFHWLLREMPIRRNARHVEFDYSFRPDWSVSAWPRLPWKDFTDEKLTAEFHVQGAYNFPNYEGQFVGSTMRWASGYEIASIGLPQPKFYTHTDYLFAYWMARLSGVLKPTD